MTQTALASNQNYIDLSYGQIKGDFSTQETTTLSSVSAVIGWYNANVNTSVSFSYIDLDINSINTESGIGDVVLKVGTSFTFPQNKFNVSPSLAIKLPTADETRLLGTGETDLGAYLNINHPCKTFICGLSLGYIKMGDAPRLDYNNIVNISLTGFKHFNKLGLGMTMQHQTALFDGQKNPLLFGIDAFYLLSSDYGLYTNIQTGLNDAAPDTGFRLGFILWV
ncbi:MAG: hypothetical protein GXP08_08190 [Gammaproteobacteria bacterium]|nr:hypothetical protein [Gammaproteobacteria bacterium]